MESATVAIALNLDAGSGLSVGAGFTEAWLPASQSDEMSLGFDNAGFLVMEPLWEDFGDGHLCTDGTTTSCDPLVSPENVVAVCDHDLSEQDVLGLRVDVPPGTYTLTCGSVPVNLTINPAFASVDACIDAPEGAALRRPQGPGESRLQPRPDRRLPRHLQRPQRAQSLRTGAPLPRGRGSRAASRSRRFRPARRPGRRPQDRRASEVAGTAIHGPASRSRSRPSQSSTSHRPSAGPAGRYSGNIAVCEGI